MAILNALLNFNNLNVSAQVGDIVLVEYDNAISLPTANDFISFAKNNKVNMSSLLGYYAGVNFVNNSTEKVELFSVGSEVSESSK